MIDRPEGKIEQIIVDACDNAAEFKADISEVLKAGWDNACPRRMLVCIVSLVFVLSCIFYVRYFDDMGPQSIIRTVTVTTYMHPAVMTSEYKTEATTVGEFLEEYDIGYDELEDELSVDMDDPMPVDMEIEVTKPITVYINVEGEVYEYTAQPGFTVVDALQALDITVESTDQLSGSLGTVMQNGDEFYIGRVTLSFDYVEESIPYTTEMEKDAGIKCGKVKVVQEGEEGIRLKTYVVVTQSGEEKERYLVKEEVKREPVNEIKHYGVSTRNTVPEDLEYIDVIKHVKCVSYNFGSERIGVYGLKCDYGTAAVDRSVLPLGTKFYVPGYGYCVANDVGSGIKDKKIDLYMPVKEQCYVWGAQWRDIYIIEWGDDVKCGALRK